jgi:hypothetical protein
MQVCAVCSSDYMLLVLSKVIGGSLYEVASDDIINKKGYKHYKNTAYTIPSREITIVQNQLPSN